ncbi:hypothetical protein [uncultured Tateyamaria sp.]|uniref:hypothetical protein n=1 Tax=Tateyamaria sp. 1078 TaxID=3417464 RepID=UPI002628CE40|nr:hypothetical protein [uncultured Tateyamaria sp.]
MKQAVYRRVSRRKASQSEGWFKRHDTTVKAVLAILGLLVTLNEYLQRQQDTRIQRSLNIYERYQTEDVLVARLVLDREWNAPAFWKKLIERHKADGSLIYEALEDLALHMTKKREVVDALFAVWAISSEASLCLVRGQCDQATICQTFWQDTQKYYGFFEPYFAARTHAWDETIQSREETTMRILDSHCGDSRYFELFDSVEGRKGMPGAWDTLRRWYYNSFNIRLMTHSPEIASDSDHGDQTD